MSRSDAALLQLAESIADGSSIDWDAAEASATHDDKAVGAFYCFFTNDASQNPAIAWTTNTNFDTIVIYNRAHTAKAGIIALDNGMGRVKFDGPVKPSAEKPR